MKETNIVRVGTVSSVNPNAATVKVIFSDIDDLVSDDLPVIFPQSLKNKAYALPDVGDNVVCIFIEQGIGDGFCIGSFYTPTSKPPVSDPDKIHYMFGDGAYVEYDRKSHKLIVDAKSGSVDVKAKSIIAECEELSGACKTCSISGESVGVVCKTGNISGDDLVISGNITLRGSITLNGSVNCPGYCTCK